MKDLFEDVSEFQKSYYQICHDYQRKKTEVKEQQQQRKPLAIKNIQPSAIQINHDLAGLDDRRFLDGILNSVKGGNYRKDGARTASHTPVSRASNASRSRFIPGNNRERTNVEEDKNTLGYCVRKKGQPTQHIPPSSTSSTTTTTATTNGDENLFKAELNAAISKNVVKKNNQNPPRITSNILNETNPEPPAAADLIAQVQLPTVIFQH